MTLAPSQKDYAPHGSRRGSKSGSGLFAGIGLGVAGASLLPMLAVLLAALTGGFDTVTHLAQTVMPRYAGTTLLLVLMVGAGTLSIGVGAAWLVTMTRFPGVRLFEMLLSSLCSGLCLYLYSGPSWYCAIHIAGGDGLGTAGLLVS